MATTNVTIRMDAELKKQAEALLKEMGMNMTTAFTVFTKQLVRDGCFPFTPDVRVPNEETRAALEEMNAILEGKIPSKSYTSVRELFEDIENEV